MKNLTVFSSGSRAVDNVRYEVVERKGIGHPDTICDAVAENISRAFSEYTLREWGVVLRHMLDKIAIQGGSSRVTFGGGEMLKPAKLYLNCRFTREVADRKVPYFDIARDAIHAEFKKAVPAFDAERWLEIVDNTHFSQGPGVVYDVDEKPNERQFFFAAPEASFLQYHSNDLRSNDTSTGVGYAPLSVLERVVLMAENMLNTIALKRKHPCVGTDIKIMGVRIDKEISLTCCVPLISTHIRSEHEYHEQLLSLQSIVQDALQAEFPEYTFRLSMNTRDNPSKSDFYLTLTGSAIESGDEGVVGRGNRINGVIPFTRHMSMEASCGKNPVYHVGKVYTVLCSLISQEIWARLGRENYVYITSQIGKPLTAPWHIGVDLCNVQPTESEKHSIQQIVTKHVSSPDAITQQIIRGDVRLY